MPTHRTAVAGTSGPSSVGHGGAAPPRASSPVAAQSTASSAAAAAQVGRPGADGVRAGSMRSWGLLGRCGATTVAAAWRRVHDLRGHGRRRPAVVRWSGIATPSTTHGRPTRPTGAVGQLLRAWRRAPPAQPARPGRRGGGQHPAPVVRRDRPGAAEPRLPAAPRRAPRRAAARPQRAARRRRLRAGLRPDRPRRAGDGAGARGARPGAGHAEPYPALVVDRHWDLVRANAGARPAARRRRPARCWRRRSTSCGSACTRTGWQPRWRTSAATARTC